MAKISEELTSFFRDSGIPEDDIATYTPEFVKNDVQITDLCSLTENDLKEMKVTKIAHIRRILLNAKHVPVKKPKLTFPRQVPVKKPKLTFPRQNSFEDILGRNLFVDKTAVIGKIIDLLAESSTGKMEKRPIFITAPRGFGKTTVLDLLECFCGGTLSEDIFRSLKIKENDQAFKWYNRFTVVYVTFGFAKDVIITRNDCVDSCRTILHSTFERYRNIESCLSPAQVSAFNQWVHEDDHKNKNETEVYQGLRFLIICIRMWSEKPVLLLLDEFDKICVKSIYNAGENLKKIIDFYSGMVANAVKHDPVCSASIFTGITAIASNGFSYLNPISLHFLNNDNFYEFYGILESEFNELMTRTTISEKVKNQADTARKWYNGYHYRDTKIFCTYSVANFILLEKIDSYWTNSGLAAGLFESLNSDRVRNVVQSLLNEEPVSIRLLDLRPEDFSHVKDKGYDVVDPGCILNFLKQQGYLTAVANTNFENTGYIQVEIPNREVWKEFSRQMCTFYQKKYNFDLEKMKRCCDWLKNMDMSNAPQCEETLRNVKTALTDLLCDTRDTDINESWYEAFLFCIFMQHSEVRSQKKVRGTEKKNDMRSAKVLDLFIKMEDRCFVVEESLIQSGEESLKKLIQKRYFTEAVATGLDYMLIGIGFHKIEGKEVDISICYLINEKEGEGRNV